MARIELPSDVRGPRTAVRYAQDNPAPGVVFLFLLAAGVASLRQGHLPDKRQTVGLLGAAIVLVAAAAYIPDVVAAFLFALVVVLAIESSDAIASALERVLALINPAAVPFAVRPKTTPGITSGGVQQ